jgi:hypothetical protein
MPKDRRPPKKWFYNCVRTVRREAPDVDDPEALCAWVWYHHMKKPTKQQILKAIPKNKRKGGPKVGKKKKRKKKKWGKIGAPHSRKRKRWLAKIRKKR